MKTTRIEKGLQFADQIKEPHSLQVRESLEYHKGAEGVHAVGPLHIQGSYMNDEGKLQGYEEVLDMDVPASNRKLSQEHFYLDIQEYQSVLASNGLDLTTLMGVHGSQEQPAPIQQMVVEQDNMQSELSASRQLAPAQPEVRDNTLYTFEQLFAIGSRENEEVTQEEETPRKSDTTAMPEFEDLFEDDETTYTSYHMAVTKGNDSYGIIAQRYDVKEDALRLANNNKEVNERALVILPSA